MGRSYAGILGLLSFATVVARSLVHGGELSVTVPTACLVLFAFAALGYVVGSIAAVVVSDSVHAKFNTELKSRLSPDDRK